MAKQAFSSYFSVFSAFFSCFCLLNERNSLYLPAEKENFINNIHFFKREIMNKTELIDQIANGSGLTKVDARKALDATVKAIKDALVAGDKIALYSYGSGAVAEVFGMTLVEGYENQLKTNRLEQFNNRKQISVDEYEKMFFRDTTVDEDGNLDISDIRDESRFVLEKIENHKRIYKKQI